MCKVQGLQLYLVKGIRKGMLTLISSIRSPYLINFEYVICSYDMKFKWHSKMYSENYLFPPTSPLRWPLLFLVSCVSSWDVLYRLSCRYAHTDILTQVVAQHTHLLQQAFFSALHLSGPSGSIIHEERLHSFLWLHDTPLHEGPFLQPVEMFKCSSHYLLCPSSITPLCPLYASCHLCTRLRRVSAAGCDAPEAAPGQVWVPTLQEVM